MSSKYRAEKDIEGYVCDEALRKYGVPNIPLKLLLGANTGWPDRVFLVGFGRVLFIEFKDPNGDGVSPKQKYMIKILKGLKYDVKVCDNAKQALKEIARAQVDAARLSKKKR